MLITQSPFQNSLTFHLFPTIFQTCFVVELWFNMPPTAMVIRQLDLRLKSHPKD